MLVLTPTPRATASRHHHQHLITALTHFKVQRLGAGARLGDILRSRQDGERTGARPQKSEGSSVIVSNSTCVGVKVGVCDGSRSSPGASPCHRPQFRDLLQRYESNMLRRPCHLAGQAGLHVPLPVPPHGFHHLGAAGAGGTVRRRFRALRPGGSGLRHGKSADHGLRPRGT